MSSVSEFSLSWIFGDRTQVKKEKKIPRRVFTFSRRPRIRKFYDMFVQWRQIIVPQSVLHVQNFCFFDVFVAVAVPIAFATLYVCTLPLFGFVECSAVHG